MHFSESWSLIFRISGSLSGIMKGLSGASILAG